MKGRKGGFNSVLKQAQKLQGRLGKVQNEIEDLTVESQVAGGAVKITINGKRQVTNLTILKDVIDPEDPGELTDLIMAAFNQAMENISDLIESETNKATGGMNMPWLL
jgi:hypothetical protein